MKSRKILSMTVIILFLSITFPVIIKAQESINTNLNYFYEPNLLPVGTDAAEFTYMDIVSEQTITFSSFAGKVVLLHFFTTYIAANILVMDEMKDVKAAYSSSQLAIVTIDIDPVSDNESIIKEYTETYYIDWYVFLDLGYVTSYYEVLVSPTFYFITPDQKVHYSITANIDADFMSGKIDEILPSGTPTPTNTGPSEFWGKNWIWILLGGVGLVVVVGLLFQRRRIIVHNRKIREEKLKIKQQKFRERNR